MDLKFNLGPQQCFFAKKHKTAVNQIIEICAAQLIQIVRIARNLS
jgi:hypothetical protein